MYIAINDVIGQVDLLTVDKVAPGFVNLVANTGSGRMSIPGMVVSAYDSLLRSGGEFMYVRIPASTAITAGTWLELTHAMDSNNIPQITAQAWAGTADTGKTLAVSYATITSQSYEQYCWVQVGGIAVSRVVATGTWAAGSNIAWSASGVPQVTAVAGKNVLNAQGVSAISQQVGTNTNSYDPTSTNGYLLSATQALVWLNRPCVENHT